jgi:hypothetical protein
LASIVDGKTHNAEDWRALKQQFGVTVTQVVAITQSFYYFGLLPLVTLPLDRPCISASNRLVNQVDCNWHEWKSQETHSLGVVSACIELIKSWFNFPGLFEFQ